MNIDFSEKQVSRRFWVLFGVASLAYIVYHLVTLIYSPLPWFDEVTFTSLTESYMRGRTLYEEARIVGEPGQKLFYGPVFFIWQTMVIKTFGFSIFTVRISNMLFGFGCLYLVYRICRHLGFGIKAAILAIVLVAAEPNFNQFLHSGRMDFMSLFFFLLSYTAFLRIGQSSKLIASLYAVGVGVLLGCAILTTPRIIFAFSVYAFYFLYELIANGNKNRLLTLAKYAVIGTSFAAVYYFWIYTTFGGIDGYIYHSTHASYLKDHMGLGTEMRFRYNMIIYLFAYLSFIVLLIKKRVAANVDLVLLTVPAITGFICIVAGGIIGRYFASVMPFISILVTGTAFYLYENKSLKYATYTMAAVFIAVFVLKGVYVFSTLPQRDPYENEKIIMQYVEPNTSVLGDNEYYYIARNNNCRFLTTQTNGSIQVLTKYVLENKIRYVILNKKTAMKDWYEPAFLNDHYTLVAMIPDRNPSGFFARILNKLPYAISDGYSCYIYKYRG